MTTRNPTPLYVRLADVAQAIHNCKQSGNTAWKEHHEGTLRSLLEHMPSGSGFDNGTTLDDDSMTRTRMEFTTAFHHMNDAGMYDGWTHHTVVVTAEFGGIDIRVTGRNRRDIKTYIADMFYLALNTPVTI